MSDGKIFISYRRADSAYAAGRLFDRLSARFGEARIFMDVEDLDPGVDFVEKLEQAVSACDLLIALIGRQWLNIADEKGRRRLDNPEDFVRVEIAAALNRDVRVIPILVQGARMPGSRELPDALKRLSRLNAVEIRHERFNSDVDRLSRSMAHYFKEDAENRARAAAEKIAREQAEREQQAQAQAEQETLIAECLEKGGAALQQQDWQAAQNNYRQILELRPDHTAAQQGLQTASHHLALARLYGRAILQQDKGHLDQALRTLRRIQGREADYRDVPALIIAIEALIAEQPPPEEDASSAWPQALRSGLRTLPRGLWYLGGGVGGILMLVIGFWGAGEFFGSLRNRATPTPALTTAVGALPTLSATPRPVTATSLPTDTAKPPTATEISPATLTPTRAAVGTPISKPSATPTEGLPQLISDDFGVPMALIPAGSFEMGGDADIALAECKKFRDDCERSWFEDEEPVHTVTLDDFYLDQYEVTNARYAACVEAGVCDPPSSSKSYSRERYYGNADYADYPVIYVSWDHAQTYCQWREARLPTEAEWEKAARGSLAGQLYPWGDTFDGTLANFCDANCSYAHKDEDYDDGYADTAPAGTYSPNGYALYDMAGNVWEWTQSSAQDYPYDPADGREDLESSGNRVLRGGSWLAYGHYLRAAHRLNSVPSFTDVGIGFRCARSP